MSAFIVTKAHISAMLQAALAHCPYMYWKNQGLAGSDLDQVGQMLLDQCVASVRYRYEDSPPEDLPGPTNLEWTTPYNWDPMGRVPSALEALKLVSCYEYQSCENPEWEKSEAKEFCETLRIQLISALPGYEEAAWEWRGEN